MSEVVVRGVTAERGERTILRDVSFDVRANEILGVIGPNGAGKTTLFECIAGVQPCTGEIPSRVFYIPDSIKPWPDQSVRWTLELQARVMGCGAAASPAILEQLDLTRLLGQRVSSLSKGETKRLNIALGLLTRNVTLFLDEPFDGLDLRQTRAVMDVLRNAGRTLALSIHQLDDAARICDRLLLLNNGEVVATGTLDELRARVNLASAPLEDIFLALT